MEMGLVEGSGSSGEWCRGARNRGEWCYRCGGKVGLMTNVFIPDRRTKAGKTFGFVRFIKVLDIDCLINNLCTIWVGRNKIHANVVRFQKEPLHKQSNKVNNKGTNNVNHGAKGMTNSYAHMVKVNQVQNVGIEDCPNLVLDETCLNHEDFSLCLLGKVKEFASLTNLKVVLGQEGYANIELKYMGGFWVMIVFQHDETKKRFQFNLAVGSWFSQIIQAYNDLVIDERVIWVEVEGVPSKWWSRNTFSRIASRWGALLNEEALKEEGYHSNRSCICTKLKTVVFDSFKMVYRGMTCWVHAIEVPCWVIDFEEDGEEGYDVNDGSHEDDMYGGVSENLKDVEGESESDREKFLRQTLRKYLTKVYLKETLLGKMMFILRIRLHEDSLKYPLGFIPNEEGDVHVEKVDNWSDENRLNDGQKDRVCVGQHVHERVEVSNDTHESTCSGHFKKSKVPRKGGSILELINDLVNVGRTMGYDITGFIKIWKKL
nr:nucleotide-binding alpha-beta plait domain-containing protein [Tanacetum cinerariifolium]